MGYSTDFYGAIKLDPPLNELEIKYLTEFANTRHMHRRLGPYFVGGNVYSQGGVPYRVPSRGEADIIDANSPDPEQPGLWCQWVPDENDPSEIVWDGGEKFYNATEWLQYILSHFIGHAAIAKMRDYDKFHFLQGHDANGFIECQGEDQDDRWCIDVTAGIVTTRPGKIVYD